MKTLLALALVLAAGHARAADVVAFTIGTDTSPDQSFDFRSDAGAHTSLHWLQGGVTRTKIGPANAANDYVTGSAAGDTVITTASKSFIVAPTSSTIGLKIDNTNKLYLPGYATGTLSVGAGGLVTSGAAGGAVGHNAISTTAANCTSSPCAVGTSVGGGWAASNPITRTSVGIYTVNFLAGFWSTAPVCVASSNRGGGSHVCALNGLPTTSSLGIVCYGLLGVLLVDSAFSVSCDGPKA